MRIRTAQLICLVFGMLLISVGGGMLGGRLAVQRRHATAPESAAENDPENAGAKEPPQPETPAMREEAFVVAPSPVLSAKESDPGAGKAAETPSEYVIQALSTSNRDDARASMKEILAAGFPTGVFEADLPGRGKWYRVYVGPYRTEKQAQGALDRVREIAGFKESFIKAL